MDKKGVAELKRRFTKRKLYLYKIMWLLCRCR